MWEFNEVKSYYYVYIKFTFIINKINVYSCETNNLW